MFIYSGHINYSLVRENPIEHMKSLKENELP